MRIIFTIPTLGTGGAERVATILANHFCKDNDVEFFVLEQSNVERYPIDPNVGIHEVNIAVKRGNKVKAVLNYITSFHRQRSALLKEIKRVKPDVVISFLPKADMLMYTVAKRNSFMWISSERNDPMARSSIERKILNFIYKKASILVCQTNKVAEYYQNQGVKRTCVIRNPLILKNPTGVDAKTSESYFITVGRLDRQKNYRMLINAFAKSTKEGCSDKLLILGDGPDRTELSKQIQILGMSEKIILMGRKKNVNDYLVNAKAFIMSSNYEGLPNAMLEAMAMGLPIISTDYFTGATREFIDEKNGRVVPVNDESQMMKAICEISVMEKDELQRMGIRSREKIKRMDVSTIVHEWEQLIQKRSFSYE